MPKYRYVLRRDDLETPGDFDVLAKHAHKEYSHVTVTLDNTLYFDTTPSTLKHDCERLGVKTVWFDILTTSDLEPHTS